MIAKETMYFLKAISDFVPVQSQWIEVEYETFINAEKTSGFRSPLQENGGTATASFGTHTLEGRVVYSGAETPLGAKLMCPDCSGVNTEKTSKHPDFEYDCRDCGTFFG